MPTLYISYTIVALFTQTSLITKSLNYTYERTKETKQWCIYVSMLSNTL